MIILENVSKFVISDISLYIPQGECVGIIGASGAGKTTLLKLISGLLEADCGYIRTIGKNPVMEKGRYKRDLSVFLTELSNLERYDSVRKNLEMISSIYRIPKREFQKEYDKLLTRLDFADYQYERVEALSLGQRMRVELAAALLIQPKLLILDEPDIGLDENGKVQLWEMLEERRKEGMTIVVSSHNLSEISRRCSRIVLLEKGKLLFYGTERRLRSKLASVDTMKLKIHGRLPDLEDLPLQKYKINNDTLYLSYDSNYLSAAEIMGLVIKQTQVAEVQVEKPNLTDIIMQLKGVGKDELNRGK